MALITFSLVLGWSDSASKQQQACLAEQWRPIKALIQLLETFPQLLALINLTITGAAHSALISQR